ncbi:DNA polymerase/3'-5' exonuclease PolX [Salinarchaeum chitinilyticum]
MSEDTADESDDATDAPDVDPTGITNDEIASLFEEFADRLEAQDVEYKPSAYRRAADNVREYPGSVAALAANDPEAVENIDRVGDAIASKIVSYVEDGRIEELEELREELPVDMEDLTAVEGVGPKTVGTLYRELGVRTLADLEAAAEAGEIQDVSGFGAKTEQNILDNLAFAKEAQGRERLGDARPVADDLLAQMRDADVVQQAEVAGSIRRWLPTIGDVDVLVATDPDDAEAAVDAFLDLADEELQAGTTKASVRIDGQQADLRVVRPDQFGAALQYFTGSKEHNVQLRNYALDRDVSLNEYGAFDISDPDVEPGDARDAGEHLAGDTEESMYEALDLPWMPAELREGRGEIEAAAEGTLPDLLEEGDVRGDLHVHSEWSDGRESIASMVEGAAAFGHDYVAITDHAEGPGVVAGMGLDDEELLEQTDAVAEVAADAEIEVFHGVEANVDADGDLSTPDDVLAELDVVVASPHSGLDGEATDRLIRAIEHPHVDILGHPSGRLLNERSGMEFDARRLGEAAAEHGVALEINANPARLDLWGEAVQVAIEEGATIAIDTDAHATPEFGHVRYGVHTARRGWAESADVLNAWDADAVRSFLE